MSRDANSPEQVAGGRGRGARHLGGARPPTRPPRAAQQGGRYAEDSVHLVLDQLELEGLQSDQRFAEVFVQARVTRYKGPLHIRQELVQLRLPEALVSQVLADAAADWSDLAWRALQRKFRPADLGDRPAQDRARQYLYRRGFAAGDCVAAVERLREAMPD